jgi:hypothetical protein
MPKVDETLRAGIPASPDFTLHDNEHGFRVAQLIARLLGDSQTSMSDVEVCLLLMASYCHDIGMSPQRAKVRAHFNYLLTADNALLTVTDISNLQAWLDSNWFGLTPPIEPGALSSSGLLLAEEITAYYCRSRHNDWSEEWIRDELGSEPQTLYAGWIDDLVTLCRSHHEGLAQLRQPRFEARLVGAPANVLNLRFLAALLRVSDVMEFAPERTPDVILRHRSIAPKSRIYWFKDHSISFSLEPTSGKILFSARTPSAAIHKAVLMTADWVDQELATCSTLEQEGAFRQGTIPEAARTNYTWPWAARLTSDIREREGGFVYIEGAFRPDSGRILSLLSGTALYGSPLAAFRELVQNAMDAVKEQIAYERLKSSDPSDERMAAALTELHSIRLTFSRDEEGYWVRCVDDGSGMTKSIIEKSLLVSGSGTRGDVRALERDAKLCGFSVGRTGQFGIGVLSYFMLSDKLVILTRRSQEAGDTDGAGWRFSTEGIGAFGELAHDSRGSRGTEIALRIKAEILGSDPVGWWTNVVSYIARVVRWVPCRLEVRDEIHGSEARSRGPGWTMLGTDLAQPLISHLIPTQGPARDMVTERDRDVITQHNTNQARLRRSAEESLRWNPTIDLSSDHPEAVGRVILPYFQLSGGESVAFFDIISDEKLTVVADGKAYFAAIPRTFSWQGIEVPKSGSRANSAAVVEVDFRDDKKISVDRNSFVEDGAGGAAVSISDATHKAWKEFLILYKKSLFNELNVAASNLALPVQASFLRPQPTWPVRRGVAKALSWSKVPLPLYDLAKVSFYEDQQNVFVNREKLINEALVIRQERYDLPYQLHNIYGGGSLVEFNMSSTGGGFVGVRWSKSSDFVRYDGSIETASCEFPLEWNDIAIAVGPLRKFYNRAHFLRGLLGNGHASSESYMSSAGLQDSLRLAKCSAHDAANFVSSNSGREIKFWVFVAENYSSEFRDILALLGVTGPNQLKILLAKELFSNTGVIDLFRVGQGKVAKVSLEQPVSAGAEWKLEIRKKRRR